MQPRSIKLRSSIIGIWFRGEEEETKQITEQMQGNEQGPERKHDGPERLPFSLRTYDPPLEKTGTAAAIY